MYRISKNKKWGYLNAEFKASISLQYDAASNFSEGLAAVKQGESWGYIDKNNKLIIDYKFNWAGDFLNNRAIVKEGEHFYFIDHEGNKVSKAYKYCSKIFNEVYTVQSNDNTIIELVDSTGKTIYTFDKDFYEILGYNLGYLSFKYKENTAVRCKMINLAENTIVVDNLDALTVPNYGIAFYGVLLNDKLSWGILNIETQKMTEPIYENVIINSERLLGIAVCNNKETLWGFIDKNGNLVIEPKYASIGPFKSGFAPVAVYEGTEMKWGIINENGEEVICPQYDYIYPIQGPK